MGKTILISSHILPELAELCNVIGIIERGQLLFSGTVDDIVRRARMGHVIHVGVTDRHEEAAKVLGAFKGVTKVTVAPDPDMAKAGKVIHLAFEDAPGASYTDIPNMLINAGFRLTKFTEEPVNLETAFMRLTKGLVQ